MLVMNDSALALSTWVLLYLSIAALWLARKPYWVFLFLSALFMGLLADQLEPIAVLCIGLFGLMAWLSQSKVLLLNVPSKIVILTLGFMLASHAIPGFHLLKIYDHIQLSSDAIPYSLYLNFDKSAVGLLLLGLTLPLIHNRKEWQDLGKQLIIKTPCVIVLIAILSLLLGFVRFEVKGDARIVIWAASNLLLTCTAEEAFFRGFFQRNLTLLLSNKRYGERVSIILASILFGLIHYAGGWRYILLASAAGAGYGWVYASTRRIEASILTHFGLNLVHFVFFTYPALAVR
jgi:uncharacterized protein